MRKGKRANAGVAKGKTIVTYRWTKYVRHEDAEEYTALGWRNTGALQGTHHAAYAELYEWTSSQDEPPPCPMGVAP